LALGAWAFRKRHNYGGRDIFQPGVGPKTESKKLLEPESPTKTINYMKSNFEFTPGDIIKNVTIHSLEKDIKFDKNGKKHQKLYVIGSCVCGNPVRIYLHNLLYGSSRGCGCLLRLKRNKNTRWTGCGDISGNYWNRVVRSASKRDLGLEISIEFAWELYLKQDGKCALTGLPIDFGEGTTRTCVITASLDRKDSKFGYTENNIQWIHKDVNRMKNMFEESYFIEICKMIAEKHTD
jgi:hypothetical protein